MLCAVLINENYNYCFSSYMQIDRHEEFRSCFNNLLSMCWSSMYENHTIKCASCGKLFTSKEDETVCDECSKELENIKWVLKINL